MKKPTDFETFFRSTEADLIQAIGEKDWVENKVYFAHEIIDIVKKWQTQNQKT